MKNNIKEKYILLEHDELSASDEGTFETIASDKTLPEIKKILNEIIETDPRPLDTFKIVKDMGFVISSGVSIKQGD